MRPSTPGIPRNGIRLAPIWPDAMMNRTCEHPVFRPVVLCCAFPYQSRIGEALIQWNRLLRRLSFAGTDDLRYNRASDIQFSAFEVHIGPLQREQLAYTQSDADIEHHKRLLAAEGFPHPWCFGLGVAEGYLQDLSRGRRSRCRAEYPRESHGPPASGVRKRLPRAKFPRH